MACQPDLGSRFHALPSELRAHIFSILLVRPVKWEMRHSPSCELAERNTQSGYTRPSHLGLHQLEKNPYVCANCGPDTHEKTWRHAVTRGFEVYVSPWRSKWTPEQRNPYLCTNCYDERWRSRPYPEPTNLPCLCARRSNLEIRLVGRQWKNEASTISFSSNVFAFDDCNSMRDFFHAMPEQWKLLINKIGLLLPYWQSTNDAESFDRMVNSLSFLHDLMWIRQLELDAKLLNDERTILALLKCHISSLRKVYFVVQRPLEKLIRRGMTSPKYIWGEFGDRVLLVGGFAEEVARSIKGQSVNNLSSEIESSVKTQRQRQVYENAQNDARLWGAEIHERRAVYG